MTRIVGLDPGERRVGVAVSDAAGITAQPWGVIDLQRHDLATALHRVIAETGAGLVVVGLPVGLSGREGPAAVRARELGATVADICGLPIEFWDERFTTTVAERTLTEAGVRRKRRRDVRDKVAAVVMLQSYLDRPDRNDLP